MIEFIKARKNLSLSLLLSILFFIRKGIQYATIGSFVPLLVIAAIMVLLVISMQRGENSFMRIVRIWAIILILWSVIRIVISIIHITIQPFDGSFHLAQQFGSYSLVFSILMLILGILMFRSSKKKRIKDGLEERS